VALFAWRRGTQADCTSQLPGLEEVAGLHAGSVAPAIVRWGIADGRKAFDHAFRGRVADTVLQAASLTGPARAGDQVSFLVQAAALCAQGEKRIG